MGIACNFKIQQQPIEMDQFLLWHFVNLKMMSHNRFHCMHKIPLNTDEIGSRRFLIYFSPCFALLRCKIYQFSARNDIISTSLTGTVASCNIPNTPE